MDLDVIFEERQYFRQFWLWMILLVLAFVTLGTLSLRLPYPVPSGQNGLFWLSIFLGLLSALGTPILFILVHLKTQVRKEGVYYKFVPFQKDFQKILFSELKSYRVVEYRPLIDYKGWGIRKGIDGKAYNVSENMGLHFEFKDGTIFLLGSQKPYDLFKAIKRTNPNKITG